MQKTAESQGVVLDFSTSDWSVQAYCTEPIIRNSDPLTKEERVRLAKLMQQGIEAGEKLQVNGDDCSKEEILALEQQTQQGTAARNKAAISVARIAVKTARCHQRKGLEVADLLQEINEHLLRTTIPQYDPERAALSTLTWHAAHNEAKLLLIKKYRSTPRNHGYKTISLDAEPDDGRSTLEQTSLAENLRDIEDMALGNIEAEERRKKQRAKIEAAMQTLPVEQEIVIRRAFGFTPSKAELNGADIGKRLGGESKQIINYRKQAGLKRLKKALQDTI